MNYLEKPLKKPYLRRCGAPASCSPYICTPHTPLSPRLASKAFSTVSPWRVRIQVIGLILLFWAAALPVFAQTGGTLENPLKFASLEKFIEGVLQAVVMIALPIIVAFMVYAGFKYIFARGNPSEITKAHANFMYVIIGTILILGAWVLATLIGGTVTQLLGN